MMKQVDRYVVAIKVDRGQYYRPGAVLGNAKNGYRTKEAALHDFPRLSQEAANRGQQAGIFYKGEMVHPL